jgi:nucleotide-binding universal stress UspA family protein
VSNPILVTLDGSQLAERVVPALHTILADGPVVLLQILNDAPAAEYEAIQDAAQAYLDGVAKQIGGETTTRIARGDAADRILAAIDELSPRLVVMSSHGHSGAARLVRGSVAERVLRHSPAPLLVTNPHALEELEGGARPWKRILVPLDGSPFAASVLDLLEGPARGLADEVLLLLVQDVRDGLKPNEPWDPAPLMASLDEQAARLEAAGYRVTRRAELGDPATEILRLAEAETDLVAMCTHGRSGPSRWVFGSVTEQVLRHCARPLLVVRATS